MVLKAYAILMHRTVFIYGCFDLLNVEYVEHIKFYDLFRSLIGLNSSSSANKLKVPSRPIISQRERFVALKAIQFESIWAPNSVAQRGAGLKC
jgi:bifunctional ADP-heptose synthase (sugar kinase/adenylyltransferase)